MSPPGEQPAHPWAIRDAEAHDAESVAALVRTAFEAQCRIYEDWSLPPMRESAATVRDAMRAGTVLLAEESGRVVGTVRACETAGGVEISRLAVDPGFQRRGIARALTTAIEGRYPRALRFQLFTGHLSEAALGLYESLGYQRVAAEPQHERLTLVHLGKLGPGAG